MPDIFLFQPPKTTLISDSFTIGADADLNTHLTDQGSAWVKSGSPIVNDIAATGKATDEVTAGTGPFYYVNQLLPADSQAQVDVAYPNNTDAVEADIGIRYNGANPALNLASYYFVAWFPDIAQARLYKAVAGVMTQLGGNLTTSGLSQTLLVKAIGSTISGFANGVLIASVTDTSISGPGFFAMTDLRFSRFGSVGTNHMTYDNLVVSVLTDVTLRDPRLQTGGFISGAALSLDSSPDTLAGAGAITCSAAMALASTDTVSGAGSVTEAGAIVLAASDTLKGAGAIIDAGAIAFAVSDTLAGKGAITEAAALAFAATDTLKGAGAITEAGAIAFANSDTLKGAGAITETATNSFSAAPETLSGAGAVSDSAPIVFSASDALNGSAALATGPSIIFAAPQSTTGGATIVSIGGVTFTSTANFSDEPGTIVASGSLSFSTSFTALQPTPPIAPSSIGGGGGGLSVRFWNALAKKTKKRKRKDGEYVTPTVALAGFSSRIEFESRLVAGGGSIVVCHSNLLLGSQSSACGLANAKSKCGIRFSRRVQATRKWNQSDEELAAILLTAID